MNNQLELKQISEKDISPRVLRSYLFNPGMAFTEGQPLEYRPVYDYEMEYILKSTGSMLIDDRRYTVREGDIIFRRPGQTTQAFMNYSCYAICFDMTGKSGKSPETYDFINESIYQDLYGNPVIDTIPALYHPRSGEKFRDLFDKALREFINMKSGSELILKSIVLKIIHMLYEHIKSPLSGADDTYNQHYQVLKRVVEHIGKNFNRSLGLKELSDIARLSPNYFQKIFTAALGSSPNQYITGKRMERGRELLVKTILTVSEIAVECGYENIPYFTYVFHKQHGISPLDFRKKYSVIYNID